MKAPRIDPELRELLGLSLLAVGGCGLALAQGHLLFVAIFGAACAVATIEAIRRSRWTHRERRRAGAFGALVSEHMPAQTKATCFSVVGPSHNSCGWWGFSFAASCGTRDRGRRFL